MRALWNGSLSFGLVNVPVRLYSATKERALKFRMLAKDDLCPISYKKVCREDDKPVDQKDIVKGYEIEKGQYVVLTDEDFKRANARKTETIDIVRFSHIDEIDPKLYEKPYYVEPEKKAAKAYALLRDALRKSGKAAIATYVAREKEHLAAIVPEDEMLVLHQLRYLDEIRDADEINAPSGKAAYAKREMDMALALIKSMTEAFEPKDFKDTWTGEVLSIIKQKAKKKRVKARSDEPAPEATDMKDILEALKRSIERDKQLASSRR